MTTFYRLKENGSILDYTEIEVIKDEKGNVINVPAFIREQYIETERKIIKLTDGSFAFEDEVNLDEEVRIKAEKEFNQAKDVKISELKSTRDSLKVEPIEYNGKFYDYDEESRDRIKDAQEALEGTELSIEWTTADNTDATLFYQDFKNIRRAVAMRADMLHKRYRQLRELVDAAQTVEEVNAITWDMAIFNEEPNPEEIEAETITTEEVVKEEEVE